MSQKHQDKYLNKKQPPDDTERKDDGSRRENEESIENEALAEAPLSDEELADVSGGANQDFSYLSHPEVPSRAVGTGTNIFEPGPTFPAPSRPEDSP